MYRVQLAYWMEDCPIWWRNFVAENVGLGIEVSKQDLAPYNGFYEDETESVVFDTEHDYVAFVLKFSGPECTA